MYQPLQLVRFNLIYSNVNFIGWNWFLFDCENISKCLLSAEDCDLCLSPLIMAKCCLILELLIIELLASSLSILCGAVQIELIDIITNPLNKKSYLGKINTGYISQNLHLLLGILLKLIDILLNNLEATLSYMS